MALQTGTYLAALQTFAQTLGVYEDVLRHEPVSAPGPGVIGAVFFGGARPIPARSGLSATSCLVTFQFRQYLAMTYEPKADIDLVMCAAVDALITAISADFDLGGAISNVDLLGAYGTGLIVEPGYLAQESTTYRVYTTTIPLIVNDVWQQVS